MSKEKEKRGKGKDAGRDSAGRGLFSFLLPRLSLNRWLLLLVLVAASARVGWVTVRYEGNALAGLQFPDEEAYLQVAQSLAAGQGLVDEFGFRATYMPAYPTFLAAFLHLEQPLFWARIVQALLAALAAPATFLLALAWIGLKAEGRRGPGPERKATRQHADKSQNVFGFNFSAFGRFDLSAAIIAGLLVALDPFQIFFSGLLLTEALSVPVLVLAWVYVLQIACRPGTRGRNVTTQEDPKRAWSHSTEQGLFAFFLFPLSVPAGVFLLAAVLLRPSAIVLAVAAPLAVVFYRRFDRDGMAGGLVMLAIVLIGLLPWAARNRAVLGEWRWLTTRGGISLYDGFRPGAAGESDLAHTKTLPEVQELDEISWDAWFQAEARALIRQEPARAVRLGVQKFMRTWSPTPNVAEYRRGPAAAVSGIWMLIALGSAAVGWWAVRRHWREWLILLLPVLVFTALHMVFVGSVRYRIPVMPMLMVLSAAGLLRLWRPTSRGSPESEAPA